MVNGPAGHQHLAGDRAPAAGGGGGACSTGGAGAQLVGGEHGLVVLLLVLDDHAEGEPVGDQRAGPSQRHPVEQVERPCPAPSPRTPRASAGSSSGSAGRSRRGLLERVVEVVDVVRGPAPGRRRRGPATAPPGCRRGPGPTPAATSAASAGAPGRASSTASVSAVGAGPGPLQLARRSGSRRASVVRCIGLPLLSAGQAPARRSRPTRSRAADAAGPVRSSGPATPWSTQPARGRRRRRAGSRQAVRGRRRATAGRPPARQRPGHAADRRLVGEQRGQHARSGRSSPGRAGRPGSAPPGSRAGAPAGTACSGGSRGRRRRWAGRQRPADPVGEGHPGRRVHPGRRRAARTAAARPARTRPRRRRVARRLPAAGQTGPGAGARVDGRARRASGPTPTRCRRPACRRSWRTRPAAAGRGRAGPPSARPPGRARRRPGRPGGRRCCTSWSARPDRAGRRRRPSRRSGECASTGRGGRYGSMPWLPRTRPAAGQPVTQPVDVGTGALRSSAAREPARRGGDLHLPARLHGEHARRRAAGRWGGGVEGAGGVLAEGGAQSLRIEEAAGVVGVVDGPLQLDADAAGWSGLETDRLDVRERLLHRAQRPALEPLGAADSQASHRAQPAPLGHRCLLAGAPGQSCNSR